MVQHILLGHSFHPGSTSHSQFGKIPFGDFGVDAEQQAQCSDDQLCIPCTKPLAQPEIFRYVTENLWLIFWNTSVKIAILIDKSTRRFISFARWAGADPTR